MHQNPTWSSSAERVTRRRSGSCKATVSPSSSTPRRSLPDLLQAAVYDLCVAQPHVAADARYTRAEWAIYVEGYTMALQMALRVLEAGERRWSLYLRTRRLETKLRKEQERG